MFQRFVSYSARAAAPSDTVDEPLISKQIPDGFMVGVTGDVKVITDLGLTVTLTGIVANQVVPIRITRIFSTGTTATGIMVLFQRPG